MPQSGPPELRRLVEEDDDLPTWEEANYWTEDKLHFWRRYIDITTKAMVGNRAFPAGLVYVDLFGGTGICTLKGTKRRIAGSVLIAAHASKPFTKIIACEKDPKFAQACQARLERTPARGQYQVLVGDCNQLIGKVASMIPDRALTLAFVDPKGLDVEFRTLAALSTNKRVDFVTLFADAYDIVRNVDLYERQDTESKLDQVLGSDSNWRQKWERLPNRTSTNVRRLFAEIYKDQLRRHLGYTHFGQRTIPGPRGPLYSLIYASKHKLGLKFWNEALKKDVSGQRELFQ